MASDLLQLGHGPGSADRRQPSPDRILAPAAVVALLAAVCLGVPTIAGQDPGGTAPPRYEPAAAETGLEFLHEHGGTGERYMVETMGSGVSIADLDVDGRLDVYFVQGAPTPGYVPSRPLHDVHFRNLGGSFRDVSGLSGLADSGYGMGSAVADYDEDGFPDLYVTLFGNNRLYRNNGDGTFDDVTATAGVGDELWGTSTAWADVDGDGLLDLYVVNYVDFDWDNHKFCGNPRRELRAYCHPDVYNGLPDRLYLNRGDGTFRDASAEAGVENAEEGKGLGVVFGDYDDDGDVDVYVANDSTRNFLYTNRGDGTFVDDALLAGVGYNEDGKTEAGMGTDWGDFDGDGRLDVYVTNLDLETNTLYRNLDGAVFTDATFVVGLGEPSLLTVGFGTNWLDHDDDGDLDLFVANGHIIDNIAEFKDNVTYAQPNHLYRNDGGTFREIHEELGPGFEPVKVSRGSAVGDLDDDGDLDLVVTNNDQPADVMRRGGGSKGRWIRLRLAGRTANRSAVAARATVVPVGADGETGAPMVREVKAGSSYLSSSEPTLHVGLGRRSRAHVTIRWPGGGTEKIDGLESDRTHLIVQGRGVVASRAPARGDR